MGIDVIIYPSSNVTSMPWVGDWKIEQLFIYDSHFLANHQHAVEITI